MFSASKLDIALTWLERGFSLAPCQPNSKILVRSFGVNQGRLRTAGDAVRWFDRGACNLAVIGAACHLILDFDDAALYRSWSDQLGAAARSYTERTPRGGYHVFMAGAAPRGVHLVHGAEIKQLVVVAPSVVDGKAYELGEGEIAAIDPIEILTPLSVPGCKTPYRLDADQRTERAAQIRSDNAIAKIKAAWSIEEVLHIYRPATIIMQRSQSPRYVMAQCPFHKDGREDHPSMWIDRDAGMWGCFTCGERGDVINLYAKLQRITNREAISRMQAVRS